MDPDVRLPYMMRQNSRDNRSLLSFGNRVGRVVTFGKKLLPFAGKFLTGYFCYDATKNCHWFTY